MGGIPTKLCNMRQVRASYRIKGSRTTINHVPPYVFACAKFISSIRTESKGEIDRSKFTPEDGPRGGTSKMPIYPTPSRLVGRPPP